MSVFHEYQMKDGPGGVLDVMKRTNRERNAISFVLESFPGKLFSLPLARDKDSVVMKLLDDADIPVNDAVEVRYHFLDCTVSLRKGRGKKSQGPLCWRVTHVEGPISVTHPTLPPKEEPNGSDANPGED